MSRIQLDKAIRKIEKKLQDLKIERNKLDFDGFDNERVFLMAVAGYRLNKKMQWEKVQSEKNVSEYIFEKLQQDN